MKKMLYFLVFLLSVAHSAARESAEASFHPLGIPSSTECSFSSATGHTCYSEDFFLSDAVQSPRIAGKISSRVIPKKVSNPVPHYTCHWRLHVLYDGLPVSAEGYISSGKKPRNADYLLFGILII